MSTVIFTAISAGCALLGLLITLLVMFGKMIEQNAVLKTTVEFVVERVERIEKKIDDALHNPQRR